MYANDMTSLVVGIPSIKTLIKIINDFKMYSGFGVNKDKTELMPLGISDKNDTVLSNLGYKIVSEMKVTGSVFTNDEVIFRNKNLSIPLSKIKKSFNTWKQKNLSIIVKSKLLKPIGHHSSFSLQICKEYH